MCQRQLDRNGLRRIGDAPRPQRHRMDVGPAPFLPCRHLQRRPHEGLGDPRSRGIEEEKPRIHADRSPADEIQTHHARRPRGGNRLRLRHMAQDAPTRRPRIQHDRLHQGEDKGQPRKQMSFHIELHSKSINAPMIVGDIISPPMLL